MGNCHPHCAAHCAPQCSPQCSPQCTPQCTPQCAPHSVPHSVPQSDPEPPIAEGPELSTNPPVTGETTLSPPPYSPWPQQQQFPSAAAFLPPPSAAYKPAQIPSNSEMLSIEIAGATSRGYRRARSTSGAREYVARSFEDWDRATSVVSNSIPPGQKEGSIFEVMALNSPVRSHHTRANTVAGGRASIYGSDHPYSSSEPIRRSTKEDLLEMLRNYETIIIVDDSSSMAGRRWIETRQALAELAEVVSQYDVDGIELQFLNSPVVGSNLTSAEAVEQIFDMIDPDGVTPTGEKLEILLLDYMLKIEDAQDLDRFTGTAHGSALKAIKPVNFIILTDGEASDDPESVIVIAARRLDSRNFPLTQIGIQFVQIGDDPRASEALRELDDELSSTHCIRDMVDTAPYVAGNGKLSSRDIAKILIGGINRRVDKKGMP